MDRRSQSCGTIENKLCKTWLVGFEQYGIFNFGVIIAVGQADPTSVCTIMMLAVLSFATASWNGENNSDARLTLVAQYVIACTNWTAPVGSCTAKRHPFLWKVEAGKAVKDVASASIAELYMADSTGPIGMRRGDGALITYGLKNWSTSSAALFELSSASSPLGLKGGWNASVGGLTPSWQSWAQLPGMPLVLLSYRRLRYNALGPGGSALTESLFETRMACASGRCYLNLSTLYTWSNRTTATSARWPPEPSGQTSPLLSSRMAVDEHEGRVYAQAFPYTGSDISVFDLKTKRFLPSIESGGVELMCLHHDKTTSQLVAIVANKTDSGTQLSLISVDVTTHHQSKILNLPDLPATLSIGRRRKESGAICSVSQTKGQLALQLHKVDPTAQPWCAVSEVHVLHVDVQKKTASTPERVQIMIDNLGPVGAGAREWRLVEPTLAYSA